MTTVLVVEDDSSTNKLLCKLLTRSGFEARGVLCGETALAVIAEARPDMIILDQMMPGIDGLEVLRLLRSRQETRDLPVVIYSAIAEGRFVEHARRKGASDVWLKGGIDPAEIPGRLTALLRPQAGIA